MDDFPLYANGLVCNCQGLIRARFILSYLDKNTKRRYIIIERGICDVRFALCSWNRIRKVRQGLRGDCHPDETN